MRVAIEISFGAQLIHRRKPSFEGISAGRVQKGTEPRRMRNGVVSGKLIHLRQRPDELRSLHHKIRDCLEHRPGLLAVWLFGSQASGRTGPESDVDIAALASQPLSIDKCLAPQMENRFRVDVVDLSRAGSVLQFEALHGRRLFRNSAEKVAKLSTLVGRYESAMALPKIGYRARQDRRDQKRSAS